MPRPKKPLKKPKDRNRHPTTGIVLGSFLRNLPLFESDFYFGMQATNLEIVDGILRDMEAQLLADYMEEERTPMPSSLVVSALSQLWIFGLYELLRTWRSRADLILTFADTLANADRLEQLRLIEKQKEKIEKLAEPSDGLVFRWPPFERVAKDPAYAAQLQSVCDNMELLFRRLEALRMTLAKHELPKSQAYAMAPGYGRIHMLTGSIYWQVLLGEDEVDIVSRRELADECDHVGHVLDDMTTDDFVELVVGERIGNVAEIMNDVGMGLWIGIDANRAGHFVPATTYVENFFRLGRSAHLT